MRFWIPTLVGLLAAVCIVHTDPAAPGLMASLLASLAGLDIAIHLNSRPEDIY